MKMSQFRQLIREEVRNVMAEAADPLEKTWGKIYGLGDRYGNVDAVLNVLDDYIESIGLSGIYNKWIERDETGATLSTSESTRLLKAIAEFFEGSKTPRANSKRVYKAMYNIEQVMKSKNPGAYTVSDDEWEKDWDAAWSKSAEMIKEWDKQVYNTIIKHLSPATSKFFRQQESIDGIFGTKKQIDTLVRELEAIAIKLQKK